MIWRGLVKQDRCDASRISTSANRSHVSYRLASRCAWPRRVRSLLLATEERVVGRSTSLTPSNHSSGAAGTSRLALRNFKKSPADLRARSSPYYPQASLRFSRTPQVAQADRGVPKPHRSVAPLLPPAVRGALRSYQHTLRAPHRTSAGSPHAQPAPPACPSRFRILRGVLARKRTNQSKSHRPHNLIYQFLKLIIGLFLKETPQKSANVTSLARISGQCGSKS